MPEVIDLIKFAGENNAVGFADTFNDIIGQKAVNFLDQIKQQVATDMFNDQADEQEQEQDLESEEESIDNGESYEDAQTD